MIWMRTSRRWWVRSLTRIYSSLTKRYKRIDLILGSLLIKLNSRRICSIRLLIINRLGWWKWWMSFKTRWWGCGRSRNRRLEIKAIVSKVGWAIKTLIMLMLMLTLIIILVAIIKDNRTLVGVDNNLITHHLIINPISTISTLIIQTTTTTPKLRNNKNSTYSKSTKINPNQLLFGTLRVKGHVDRFSKTTRMITSLNRSHQSSRIYDPFS